MATVYLAKDLKHNRNVAAGPFRAGSCSTPGGLVKLAEQLEG